MANIDKANNFKRQKRSLLIMDREMARSLK